MKDVQKYLIDAYNELAFTHNYIFGWHDSKSGMVYAYMVRDAANLLPYISKLDKASSKNGGTIQLKFTPNRDQKNIIIAEAWEVKPICTANFLEMHKLLGYRNRGYMFETLVAKAWGGELAEKSNAKFTDCGDVTISGEPFQVKYERATFTDERTVRNLRGW